ncbi:MAG: heparinase II/III family protein [Candidatus Latescibacteria bacterium]|nr:heparinase II/III family protein [Candidatus Latescibacterota bacterium]
MRKVILVLVITIEIISLKITDSFADSILEPYTYSENFESRELAAWASYPLWQDTAYDDNFRVNEIISGDPNISIEQKVTPYSHNDVYAGAQKKLDMYITPESSISLRYYIKTHLPVEFLKVRIGAASDGKIDYTVQNPTANHWVSLEIVYNDFVNENTKLDGKERIKVYGIAVLVKVPDADPDMPVYFGLDDIVINGSRAAQFRFSEPTMHKLLEWKPYIPAKHYHQNDIFTLNGSWPFDADTVTMTLSPFTDRGKVMIKEKLKKNKNRWYLEDIRLLLDPGLYIGTLKAQHDGNVQAETEFTLYIAPVNPGKSHPRLWFSSLQMEHIKEKLKTETFRTVRENISSQAQHLRDSYPPGLFVYDFDQFPDEDWLITRYAWSRERIRNIGDVAYWNALDYALLKNSEAGEYTKTLLISYAQFPSWNHPWMKKRGRHFYLFMGDMAMYFACAYDLIYDLLDDYERVLIRDAFRNQVIVPVHKSYVDANLVTNHTSNWIAAILGGSIMCQAAIYGEESEYEDKEPYFTGSILKQNALIQHVIGRNGGYGEGYNYYNYSSLSWSKCLPALENVFNIDLSEKLNGAYSGLAWAGLIRDKKVFYFGDSRGNIQPMDSWAWLLPKYKDPLLGWMYYYLNMDVDAFEFVAEQNNPPLDGTMFFPAMKNKTLMDLIYDTEHVPVHDPFDDNPVRLFKDIGTTVFKSGWESEDFVFVMRSGPFYNHQHLDQGTFWLADRGTVLIGERQGSAYYDDPFYESHYTQPIAHSTILIDHNPQSQRTGDPLSFIEGFDDHAFVNHFLDGEQAAFVSGDIGRLYWGKVKEMQRNVLYLKPRTLIMLDTIEPTENDVDVSLLYQSEHLKDIDAGNGLSTITKGDVSLFLHHVYPGNTVAEAKEMPHFLREFDRSPLVRNGYLQLTARPERKPLVIGNILTTEHDNKLDITSSGNDGCVNGTINGIPFVFTADPGKTYDTGGYISDALALTWTETQVFAAICTTLSKDGTLLFESKEPVTFELNEASMKYYIDKESMILLGVPLRPQSIYINGESVTFMYDSDRKTVIFTVPEGEGTVTFE